MKPKSKEKPGKFCSVVIRDEDYNVIKEFSVKPKYAKFINDIGLLFIAFGFVCLLALAYMYSDAKAYKKLDEMALVNQELEIENKMLLEKCMELEYSVRNENLHNLIGYYSVRPNSEINKDKLYKFLNEHKDVFLYPDIIYAQVVLESNVGKSRLYKISNNLIGMYFPERRETTAIGKTNTGYATYKNWQMCVLDRPLWDKIMFKKKTPTKAEYLAMLKRRYASDPNYIRSIQHIIITDYNKR